MTAPGHLPRHVAGTWAPHSRWRGVTPSFGNILWRCSQAAKTKTCRGDEDLICSWKTGRHGRSACRFVRSIASLGRGWMVVATGWGPWWPGGRDCFSLSSVRASPQRSDSRTAPHSRIVPNGPRKTLKEGMVHLPYDSYSPCRGMAKYVRDLAALHRRITVTIRIAL